MDEAGQYPSGKRGGESLSSSHSTWLSVWLLAAIKAASGGNNSFLAQHIAGHGVLGHYFNTQLKGSIKMGDKPSVVRLLRGDSEEPAQPSW